MAECNRQNCICSNLGPHGNWAAKVENKLYPEILGRIQKTADTVYQFWKIFSARLQILLIHCISAAFSDVFSSAGHTSFCPPHRHTRGPVAMPDQLQVCPYTVE